VTTSPERDDGDMPPADLAARVLLGCEGELATLRRRATLRPRLALAGLAAVALFTLTLHVSLQPPTGGLPVTTGPAVATPPAVAAAAPAPAGAAHWLASTLRPDGRFDTGRLEVPSADEVGLHALALLALASADVPAERAPETSAAALRAARWLLDQQDDDGSIGAPVGAGFDHALGTVALLEAGVLTGDAAVREGADRAVALIAQRQAQDGGWQPRAPGRAGASPAQTAWTLAALLRAQQLGATELQPAIARGQARLVADLGSSGLAAASSGLAAGGDRAAGRDGLATAGALTPADLDLSAVRAVALGASRPHGPTPAGGLYAASIAVLASHAIPR